MCTRGSRGESSFPLRKPAQSAPGGRETAGIGRQTDRRANVEVSLANNWSHRGLIALKQPAPVSAESAARQLETGAAYRPGFALISK